MAELKSSFNTLINTYTSIKKKKKRNASKLNNIKNTAKSENKAEYFLLKKKDFDVTFFSQKQQLNNNPTLPKFRAPCANTVTLFSFAQLLGRRKGWWWLQQTIQELQGVENAQFRILTAAVSKGNNWYRAETGSKARDRPLGNTIHHTVVGVPHCCSPETTLAIGDQYKCETHASSHGHGCATMSLTWNDPCDWWSVQVWNSWFVTETRDSSHSHGCATLSLTWINPCDWWSAQGWNSFQVSMKS